MIFGIGIDLIETIRVYKKTEGNHDFKKQVFTPEEIAYCESKAHPAQHYAARFAAKEAFFKALGTGWRGGMKFTEIEIRNDSLGKPEFILHGKTKKIAEELHLGKIHLSLSHLKEIASAYVIIESD